MSIYKSHYACFNCRKTFKRRLGRDIRIAKGADVAAKCPQCAELMANMGLDFQAPKQNDIKAWQHMRNLYSVGIAFHSCGCTGPGYIPKTTELLIQYFGEILKGYHANLIFWRQRVEPTNKKEIDREMSKYGSFINKIPGRPRHKNEIVSTEDAMNYWFSRIREVELKLQQIRAAAL